MNARPIQSVPLAGTKRFSIALGTLAACCFVPLVPVRAAPGNLDVSFSTDGKVVTSINGNGDQGQAVAVQSDGNILVAGYSSNGDDNDFTVLRYTTTGTLDTRFGEGGRVITAVGSRTDDRAYSVAVQADGRILLAGRTQIGGSPAFAMVRYLPDGRVDRQFGEDGRVFVDLSADEEHGRSIALQSDGGIVVAGYSGTPANYRFLLMRFDPGGILDNSFSTDGIVTLPIGHLNAMANAVALQADGKIVVAGQASNGSNDNIAIARFNANGTLDTTFDTDGKVTTNIAGSDDAGSAVVVHASGKILVAGRTRNVTHLDFAVARYNSDGSLDTTFSDDGIATTAIGSGDDQAYGIGIQADNRIVVAGASSNGSNRDFAVACLRANGTMETTFGDGGIVTTAFDTGDDIAYGVLVQPDGGIVAAGATDGGSGTMARFATARYLGTTAPEIGVQQPAGSNLGDGSVGVTFGKLQVGGTPPTMRTFTVLNTGSATLSYLAITKDGAHTGDFTVGALGATTLAPGASTTFTVSFSPLGAGARTAAIHIASNDRDENPFDISLSATGLVPPTIITSNPLPSGAAYSPYHLAFAASGGTSPYTWSIVASSLPSPLYLDSSTGRISGTPNFATTANFTVRVFDTEGSHTDKPFSLTITSSFNPGELDTSFVGFGKAITPVGSSSDLACGIVAQPDGKLIVAGSFDNGGNHDFALARYSADGFVDLSFGNNGIATTPVGASHDFGNCVAVQTDGRILVAGSSHNGANDDFAVVRFLTSGTPDTTFGTGGKVTTAIGTGNDSSSGMALQPDGKIVLAGSSFNAGYYDFSLARYKTDGSLDTSFDGDGKVTTAVTSGHDGAVGVAVQSDGKIVAAGYAWNGANNDIAVVRYHPDGTLDDTFGVGGKVTTAIGSSNERAYCLLVQGDGKILVAGGTETGGAGGYDFALLRYGPNGALDAAFGTGGVVTTPVGNASDIAYAMTLQSDGKIVLAGSSHNGGDDDFAVARYRSDGAPDITFFNGGKTTTAVGFGDDAGYGVLVQNDGRIVVAGDSRNDTDWDFALVRYQGTTTPEIAVEQPVGTNLTNKISSIDFGGAELGSATVWRSFTVRNVSTATLTGLAVGKDGTNADDFITGGLGSTTLAPGASATFPVTFTPLAAGSRTALIHITSNDSDEKPFTITLAGTGRVAPTITTANPLPQGMVGAFYEANLAATGGTPPYTWSLAYGILPQGLGVNESGRVLGAPTAAGSRSFVLAVTGADGLVSTKAFDLRISPAIIPGALDPTLDDDGMQVTPIRGANDYGRSVAVQADGKILVAGDSNSPDGYDFAVARYLPDGSLDPSFGGDGIVTTNLGSENDWAYGIAVQADGRILVAGHSNDGFALARYLDDGTLDTSFNGSGMVVSGIYRETWIGYAVAVQNNGKIVVAGTAENHSITNFALARFNTDGSLDTSFGTNGRVTTSVGTADAYGMSLAIQANGRLVVAGYAYNGANEDFALARYNTDGSPDNTFGSGGKVVTGVSIGGNDMAYGVALQSDQKILASGIAGNSTKDFALLRYNINGTLDNTFDADGKVTTAIGSWDDGGRCVSVQPDASIVVAGHSFNGANEDFAVVRYLATGALDTSFHTTGKVVTPIGTGYDHALAAAIQPDGRIVVAGFSYNGTDYDFALARYISTVLPEIAVTGPADINLTDGSSVIDFGPAIPGGEPVVRTFTVKNAGTAGLAGLAVTIDGANGGEFVVSPLACTTVAPGITTTFTVTFTPGATGARTAALHLASNDANENPFDISLTGEGSAGSPLRGWRLAHFGNPEDSGNGANLNDYEKDGLANILEYAFGGNPKLPDPATLPAAGTFADGKLSVSFWCDAVCTDIIYTVQASSSLDSGPWTDIARSVGGAPLQPIGTLGMVNDSGTGRRRATVTASAAVFPGQRGFLRVRVSE